MRILHVSPDLSPGLGGSVTAALKLCRALARHGAQISVYTTNLDEVGSWSPLHHPKVLPDLPPVDSEGLSIHYFPARWPSRFAFSPELGRRLDRDIQRYDVVHVHRLYR